MNQEERLQVNSEIKEILRKGAIQLGEIIRTWRISEQFVHSKQKGWRSSTCNKSQISEQLRTIPSFQNERDAFNKRSSPKTRLFDKDGSKRCLFWHTSRQKLKKIYSFSMGRKFIQIHLLMFWPGSSPLIFTELPMIPVALLRRIIVRIIIFLDSMLVIAQTLKEILQAKETLIFLLQNFGFVINFTKSQLIPVTEMEFLGLLINSVNMTLALPQEKVLDIQNQCAQLIASPKATIMELTELLRKLLFNPQAVLPGRIQCRQIWAVTETNSYQTKIILSQQ